MALLEQDIIGSTGRMIRYEHEDGSTEERPEPEPIHTYAGWKSLGYQVQKGEKAVDSFQIWKHQSAGERMNRKTGEVINVGEKMFLTKASFFCRRQVEAIESGS